MDPSRRAAAAVSALLALAACTDIVGPVRGNPTAVEYTIAAAPDRLALCLLMEFNDRWPNLVNKPETQKAGAFRIVTAPSLTMSGPTATTLVVPAGVLGSQVSFELSSRGDAAVERLESFGEALQSCKGRLAMPGTGPAKGGTGGGSWAGAQPVEFR